MAKVTHRRIPKLQGITQTGSIGGFSNETFWWPSLLEELSDYLWYFARFGTIATIKKLENTPLEER